MVDTPAQIAEDIAAIARIDAVPTLLEVICTTTGMGFSAVARVTEGSWTACAVHDDIGFGLVAGSQLEIGTTLCNESRQACAPVFIDHASQDATYRDHHTPRIYGIESYISVPIVMKDGEYFGNLCAIDRKPARVSEPRVLAMFEHFAKLIALQLHNDRSAEQTRSALSDERALGELREQFIAILGHDLRGPLAGILAGAEYLQIAQAGLDPPAKGVAARIGSSARRMSSLIDDILDFARGRLGGGFAVNLAQVHDVAAALHQVVAESQAGHPDRPLIVDIESPHAVLCDRERLQQLAANLLTNALVHGAPGTPVYISAKVGHGSIVLTVSNEGEPIPAASLATVFEPFRRPETSQPRAGLGLGLFICAQIVKAHGGQIEVASSAESGTTFAARLPIGVPDTSPHG